FFPGTHAEYRVGYRAQASYLIRRTLAAASQILDRAHRTGRSAVIIVHGDHGPRLGLDARASGDADTDPFRFLLAIHWPNGSVQEQDEPKSLVNVYRTLFRSFMGAELSQLPDRSYVSPFV